MALVDAVALVAFAFTAGAVTFFAPCAYPLLPGYVAYYLGESSDGPDKWRANGGVPTARGRVTGHVAAGARAVLPDPVAGRVARAFIVSLVVSAGFFLVYALLAGVVAAAGAQLLADISILELVVGVLLVVIGGSMAAGRDIPAPRIRLPARRRSTGGYFCFGVLYAAAAAGCTAPLFVGVALKALAAGAGMSLLTFGAYAAGMSVLMMAVTVATALGRGALVNRFTGQMDRIHRAAGVLLVLAGLVEIYLFLFRFDGLAMLGL